MKTIKKLFNKYMTARQEIKELGLSKKQLFEVMKNYKSLIDGGLNNE